MTTVIEVEGWKFIGPDGWQMAFTQLAVVEDGLEHLCRCNLCSSIVDGRALKVHFDWHMKIADGTRTYDSH